MTNEKSEMVSVLNVKVINLNNQVLEKDVMLSALRERLKSMEVGLAQKEQEVNDLKHKDAVAYRIIKEKLKSQVLLECNQMLDAWKEKLRMLEVKVLQKEQEVHDFKQQEIVAYRINEENLLVQVSERDQMLSERDESLRIMEAKELRKEQEINDLNLQNAAAYKVMVERLRNHVLESNQLLNLCEEKLKSLEAKVLQLEQELNDLKYRNLTAFQISEEKLKLMELKVAQKEQEIHELECQKSEACKLMEEKLKNHVLENNKILNEFEENLKLMVMNVVRREQEVDDLKRQILASFQISKEKLKIMEVKVVQKEKELHDLNHKKVADYQIIRKLTHKQTEAYQREEALMRQNSEASENVEKLKQLLLAVERDKLKSDEELKDIKEKQLEAGNNLKKLRRENLVALRAIVEIKECTLAADETCERNKETSEGFLRSKTVKEIKVLEIANSVLKEAVDASSPIPKGGKKPFRLWTWIDEGSGDGDGDGDDSFGQVASQYHSSPKVEASCSAVSKMGTGKLHCSASVQVAYSDGIVRSGELEYPSNLHAPVNSNIINKRQKVDQTQKLSQESAEPINLNSSKKPSPVLRSCKDKAVSASDSRIRIINIDSSSDEEPPNDSHMDGIVR